MNLQNGYKVIYEKAEAGKRTFYASKTGVFADAKQLGEAIEIGKYKLIYEKNGSFYGSETGIPAESDYRFEAFDEVFVAGGMDEQVATVDTEGEKTTAVVTEPEQPVGSDDEGKSADGTGVED